MSDFNADTQLDLASVGGVEVNIRLGNGNGTFQPVVSYEAGISPETAAVGDFNGDGSADLVVTNYSYDVHILLNNGNGTFQPAVKYAAGPYPTAVAVGDLNRNGRLDLAVSSSDGARVVLRRLPATHLRVEAPATTSVGKAVNLTVTALDALDVPVPAYACTVHFASTDPRALLSIDDDFNALWALTPEGELRWVYPFGSWFSHSSPAIGLDGTIYTSSGFGEATFYALAPDGTVKWRGSIGTPDGTPSIGDDGTVYVPSS